MPNSLEKLALLPILKGLSPSQLSMLRTFSQVRDIPANACFIKEGEIEKTIYIITKGSVAIFKSNKGVEHIIATLHDGESIGELALLDDECRSASARTMEETTVVHFDIEQLKTDPALSEIYGIILKNIGPDLAKRIRKINTVAINALKTRLAMGNFMLRILTIAAVYSMSLRFITDAQSFTPHTTLYGILLIVIFTLIIFDTMRASGYPLATYGLTMVNWKRALFESMAATIPILAVVTFVKWLLILYVPKFHNYMLFDFSTGLNYNGPLDLKFYALSLMIYIVFSPAQELIVRGGIQSSMQKFLMGSENKVRWSAIFISNLLFASAHIHLTIYITLAVFFFGVLWGWLYSRHHTLFGVSASHILVGVYILFILGVKNILFW